MENRHRQRERNDFPRFRVWTMSAILLIAISVWAANLRVIETLHIFILPKSSLKSTGSKISSSPLLREAVVDSFNGFAPVSIRNVLSTFHKDPDCSCLTPHREGCCSRMIYLNHKMGHELARSLLRGTDSGVKVISAYQDRAKLDLKHLTNMASDFRIIMLVRGMFDSLVSGYLYHKAGMECWLDAYGRPMKQRYFLWTNWTEFVTFAPRPPKNRSICQYMVDESEAEGMHAYIETVFRAIYDPILLHWASARIFPELGSRTKVVCYEDFLTSREKAQDTLDGMMRFWSNGTQNLWVGKLPDLNYSGRHATSHDESLRTRLHQIIQEIDNKYYNGTITLLDFMMRC